MRRFLPGFISVLLFGCSPEFRYKKHLETESLMRSVQDSVTRLSERNETISIDESGRISPDSENSLLMDLESSGVIMPHKSRLVDSWGNPFRFKKVAEESGFRFAEFVSLGENGVYDGGEADDLTVFITPVHWKSTLSKP